MASGPVGVLASARPTSVRTPSAHSASALALSWLSGAIVPPSSMESCTASYANQLLASTAAAAATIRRFLTGDGAGSPGAAPRACATAARAAARSASASGSTCTSPFEYGRYCVGRSTTPRHSPCTTSVSVSSLLRRAYTIRVSVPTSDACVPGSSSYPGSPSDSAPPGSSTCK